MALIDLQSRVCPKDRSLVFPHILLRRIPKDSCPHNEVS